MTKINRTCPDPHFEFDAVNEWWMACTRCGGAAWEHEQADPLQDTYNLIEAVKQGLPPGSYPPTMKPAETETP